jgi:PAS domain S-box-containing protein/putative nucleotidyltransferase with HDIG domain
MEARKNAGRVKLMISKDAPDADVTYRALFENTGTAMITISEDTTIVLANNEFENMTGYSKRDVEGVMKWTSLVHQEDLPTMQDYHVLRRYNPHFAPRSYYFRFHHKNGEIRNAIVTTTMIPSTGQSIASMIDVTEKARAEEELKLNSQLLDLASEAIFMHDFSEQFIYVNRACTELTGYSKEELLGMKARQLDTPEYAAVRRTHIRKIMETGAGTFEAPTRRKDGTPYYIEVHCKIIEVNGSKYVFNSARDITQRKEAEKALQQSYGKLQKTLDGFIGTIATMSETRDPYTAGHQRQVSKLAHAMAGEMQLEPNICESIRIAGVLHDIGKLSIPAEILSKPGKLSNAEFAIIKRHPEVGCDILKTIEFPWPICGIVSQHHERLDGTGYPVGLKGDDICLEAKILAVADVVEAMASHRPYRPSLGIDVALDEVVKNKGTKYDMDAVDACVRLVNQKGFSF